MKKTMNKSIITTTTLTASTIIVGFFLASSFVSADDSQVDNVSVNIPVSCSLSGTGMNSHNANIVNGTYQADIGTTTIKAYCNDSNGFAIYAIGFTDDEYGKTVLTNSTLGSTYDIATGTATSGSTSNWAMKLATNTSATYALTLDNGFGSYSSVPATYTKVAHRDSGTDTGTSATGSELTSTYAAYMNQTQPAGTYTGQVKYTLVHPASEEPLQPRPATAGCINYFANASTAIGEMGCQSATNNASTTLWASNFKRDGYGFAGWSDKYDYDTNPDANIYGPQETITTPSGTSTKGLSLYAIWIKSEGSMQSDASSICNNLDQSGPNVTKTLNSVSALTDDRDNNTYAIAKLADGKCWMIENLRLADKDNNGNDINLDSTNTHNPSSSLNNSWYYRDLQTTLTISNHLSLTTNPTQTAWCTSSSAACNNQSMLATNNSTLYVNNTASNYSVSSDIYSYGNYYNWYSATAGHGEYDAGTNNFSVVGDICPTNWHLPIGGNSNNSVNSDFWNLGVSIMGFGNSIYRLDETNPAGDTASKALRKYPNNYIYSGGVYGSSINGRNSSGNYWSSSAGNNNGNAYYMYIDSGYVNPGTESLNKINGRTVRCVAGV